MHASPPSSRSHRHQQRHHIHNSHGVLQPGRTFIHPYLCHLGPKAFYSPNRDQPSDDDLLFFARLQEVETTSQQPVIPSKPSWQDTHGYVTPICNTTFPLPPLYINRQVFIETVGRTVLSLFQSHDPSSTLSVERFYAKDTAAYLCCGPQAAIAGRNLQQTHITIFLTLSSNTFVPQPELITAMMQGCLVYLSNCLGYAAPLPEAMLAPYLAHVEHFLGDNKMGLELTLGPTTFSFVFMTPGVYITDSRALFVSMKHGTCLSLSGDYQKSVNAALGKIISRSPQALPLTRDESLYPWDLFTSGHQFESPAWIAELLSTYSHDPCFTDHLACFLKEHKANDPIGQIAFISNLSLYALWNDDLEFIHKLSVLLESMVLLQPKEKALLIEKCPLVIDMMELLISSTWAKSSSQQKKELLLSGLLPYYDSCYEGRWKLRSPPPPSPRGPLSLSLPSQAYAALQNLYAASKQPSQEELWQLWEKGSAIVASVAKRKATLQQVWPELITNWFFPVPPKILHHTLDSHSPSKDWLYLLGCLPRTNDLVPCDLLLATKFLWMAFLTEKKVSLDLAKEWWTLIGILPFLQDPIKAQSLLTSLLELHSKLPKTLASKPALPTNPSSAFLFQYYNVCAKVSNLHDLLDKHLTFLQDNNYPIAEDLLHELVAKLAACKQDTLKALAWQLWLQRKDFTGLPEVLLSRIDVQALSSLEKQTLALRLLSVSDQSNLKIALFKTVYQKDGLPLFAACRLFSSLAKDKAFKATIESELMHLCSHFLPVIPGQEELASLFSLVTSLSPGNYQEAAKAFVPLFESLDTAACRFLSKEEQQSWWDKTITLHPRAFYYYIAMHLAAERSIPQAMLSKAPDTTFAYLVKSLTLQATLPHLTTAWALWSLSPHKTLFNLPEALLSAQCQSDLVSVFQPIGATIQLLDSSKLTPEERKILLRTLLILAQAWGAKNTFEGYLKGCTWLDNYLHCMTTSSALSLHGKKRAAQKPATPSEELHELARFYLQTLLHMFTWREERFLDHLLSLLADSMEKTRIWHTLTSDDLDQPMIWIGFGALFQRLENDSVLLRPLIALFSFFIQDRYLNDKRLQPHLISTLASAANNLLAIRKQHLISIDIYLEEWLVTLQRVGQIDQLADVRTTFRLQQMTSHNGFSTILNALLDYLVLPSPKQDIFEICLQHSVLMCQEQHELLSASIEQIMLVLERAHNRGLISLEPHSPNTLTAYFVFLGACLQGCTSRTTPLQLARGLVSTLPDFLRSKRSCTAPASQLMIAYLNALVVTPDYPYDPKELVSWAIDICCLDFITPEVRFNLSGILTVLLILRKHPQDPKQFQLVDNTTSVTCGIMHLKEALTQKWIEPSNYAPYLIPIFTHLIKSGISKYILEVWNLLQFPSVFENCGLNGPIFVLSIINYLKPLTNYRRKVQDELLQSPLFSTGGQLTHREYYENAWITFFYHLPLDHSVVEAYQDLMKKIEDFQGIPPYNVFSAAQGRLSALYASLKKSHETFSHLVDPLTLSLFGQTFIFDKHNATECLEFCALAMADLFSKLFSAIVHDDTVSETSWYDLSAALSEVQTHRTIFAMTHLWIQRAKAFPVSLKGASRYVLKEGFLILKFYSYMIDSWPATVPYLAMDLYSFLATSSASLEDNDLKSLSKQGTEELIVRQKIEYLEHSQRLVGLNEACRLLSWNDRKAFLCRLSAVLPGLAIGRLPFKEVVNLLSQYGSDPSKFVKKQRLALLDWMQEIFPHVSARSESLEESEKTAQLQTLTTLLTWLLHPESSLPKPTIFSYFLAYTLALQYVHTQEELETSVRLFKAYCSQGPSEHQFGALFLRWMNSLLTAPYPRDAVLAKVLDFLRHLQVTCQDNLLVKAKDQISYLNLADLFDPKKDYEFHQQCTTIFGT